MSSTDEVSSPTSSKRPRESREFPKIKSYGSLAKCYGTVVPDTFPVSRDRFFEPGAPQAARNFAIGDIDFKTKADLLQLLSRPVTQVRHLVNARTKSREKPLYVFLYDLLAACRHGNLIISAEGLEGEQGSSDSKDEGEEWGEEEEEEEEEEEGKEEGECCSLRPPVPLSGVYWRQIMRKRWFWYFFRSFGCSRVLALRGHKCYRPA